MCVLAFKWDEAVFKYLEGVQVDFSQARHLYDIPLPAAPNDAACLRRPLQWAGKQGVEFVVLQLQAFVCQRCTVWHSSAQTGLHVHLIYSAEK